MVEKLNDNVKIGILNQGQNNTIVSNEFIGLDVGIKDEGLGTLVEKNKFNIGIPKEKWYKRWLENIIIGIIVTFLGALLILLIKSIILLCQKFLESI